MIIVYGTRCYGRADVIEGMGHVACRFVHIMFVPLIPIETVFLIDENRGIKLPFSFKAAASGWLRGGAILAGIGFLIGGFASFSDSAVAGAVLLVLGILSFAAFPLFGKLFGSVSPSRRAELLALMGIDPQSMPAADVAAQPQSPQGHAPPQQQPAFQQPAGGFGQPAYGAPPPAGAPGYGPPPGGYGPPPQGFAPPPSNGYGAPPQAMGAPQGAPQGYGPPPGGYGPPPQGFGPPTGGYGPPPQGFGPPPGYDPNRR